MSRGLSRKGFLRLSAAGAGALVIPPVTARAARAVEGAPASANTMDKYPDSAISQNEIMLWPGVAPGSEGLRLTQTITERSTDPKVHDRAITGVTEPSIVPFFPSNGRINGAAVLILPGGGYARLAFDKEGYDIAQWLTSIGVTAFVLKYRLPGEGHEHGYNVPLQDAQRAARIIRRRASEWEIDVNRVGVMGFSAGGHAASTLGTQYSKPVYSPVDSADHLSAKPNFMLLGYPVISMKDGVTHVGSRENLIGQDPSQEMIDEFSSELHVGAATPPTFIVQANDDSVSTENSVLFYRALKNSVVDAEMHIFRKGGHGYGIRNAKGSLALWPMLAHEWLRSTGFAE
jgi:acetyl esterase/lipase